MTEAMIHPAFQVGVTRVLERIEHERADAPTSNALTVRDRGVSLTVMLDGDTVTAAFHDGARGNGERAVLELICRVAIGAPLQDVGEHAAGLALERLIDRSVPAPVPGILTPRNAGAMFQTGRTLARALWDEHCRVGGGAPTENTFERPLSTRWLALDKAAKITHIIESMRSYENRTGSGANVFEFSTLDEFDRVFVIIGGSVPPEQAPEALMNLERHMRQRLGERIEVFAEEAKDSNRIRRL